MGLTRNDRLVPDGWRVARLGDVAEVAFSSVDKKSVDGEIPVELCNYTDVFYNRRIRPNMEFMTATASLAECQKWTLKKGDVLFTKDSESPDEIGIPAFVTEDMPNVLCGYHLGLARAFIGTVSGDFLARALGSRASAREFARVANGVTRFGLTLGSTRSLPILLPPLSEQRAIAAVLDSIDEAIERTEAVIAATERLRDALLHELLTRGVPGWHTEWKDAPGIGTIPADWEVVRLGDVCKLIQDGDWIESKDQGGVDYRLLQLSNIGVGEFIETGTFRWITHETFKQLNCTAILPGDVLIARMPDPIGRAVYIAELRSRAITAVDIAIIRTKTKWLFPQYAAYYFNSPTCLRKMKGLATGTTRKRIRRSDIAAQRLPLPRLAEQQTTINTLGTVSTVLDRARIEKDMLTSLKASAADALLAGRVRTVQMQELM